MELIGGDLRYALCALVRRPASAFAAVAVLGIGMGATTAIFSVVYGVLISPLPYPDAHELVSVRHVAPGLSANSLGLADSMYVTYREESRTFEEIGLWGTSEQTLTGIGEAERIPVLRVTDGTLDALSVPPVLGRLFSEAEYEPQADGPDPVIVSYAFWQRRLGGGEAALGRTLRLDDRLLEIVGVMPAEFRFLDVSPVPDAITATRIDETRLTLANLNFSALARLRDGVTLAEASADVARMLPMWLDAWPERPRSLSREAVSGWGLAPALRPLKDDVVGNVTAMLWLLMGAVGAVLLMACANVANFLLVRADERRREIAIRAALGASPQRIARQLLLESILLGAIGAVVGLALAYAGLKVFVNIAPPNLPRVEDIAIGSSVVAFAIAVSLIASLGFGAIPAFTRARDGDALRGAGTHAAGGRQNRTRNTLVVGQVALATVLLVAAGLMVRTFQALSAVDVGFARPEDIQLARTFMPPTVFQQAELYTREQRDILARIAALNGVTAAGFSSGVPLEGRMALGGIAIEDRVDAADAASARRRFLLISPGYLEAVGTRLVAGRDLEWGDLDQGRKVALVSSNLARELWGDPQAAIGKRIREQTEEPVLWREVIGVTQDVYNEGLYVPPPPLVYWPAEPQFELRGINYVIRSERAGTGSLIDEVRHAISVSSPDLATFQVRTMEDIYSASLARTSFMLVLTSTAGALALGLGVLGVYGVLAYIVTQRVREIGIRTACGAAPGRLVWMFLLQGVRLSALGAAVGLLFASGLGRLMSSLLFGVGPMDPAVYALALAIVVAAAALASYVPSRRAATIDPIETLRAE